MLRPTLLSCLVAGSCGGLVSCGVLAGIGSPPMVASEDAGDGAPPGDTFVPPLLTSEAGPDSGPDAAPDAPLPDASGGSQCDSTYRWGIEGLDGSTWYVSASNGLDTNPGTEAAPWQTIQQAGAVVGPGDTVIVMTGTYASPVFGDDTPPCAAGDTVCVIRGTNDNPILFEADPCAAPGSVILGETAYPADPDTAGFGFYLEQGCDDVDVAGFTVTNAGTKSNISRGAIFVAANNNQILGNTVQDVSGYGIMDWGGSNVVIRGNTVSGVDSSGSGSSAFGISVQGNCEGVSVLDNTISGNQGVGLFIDGDVSDFFLPGAVTGMTIRGNVISDNVASGIGGDGLQSSLIENNVIYGNQAEGISLYEMDAYGGSTSNTIVNNTIDETEWPDASAISITACAYDGTPTLADGGTPTTPDGGPFPAPPGCTTATGDTSTGNVAFDNILLGSSGPFSTVSPNDLVASTNITVPSPALFVDSAHGNYTLAPDGGAIGTGLDEFDGQDAPPTPDGLPDIGAFSFVP